MLHKSYLKGIDRCISYLVATIVLVCFIYYVCTNIANLNFESVSYIKGMTLVTGVVSFCKSPVGVMCIAFFLSLMVGISVYVDLITQTGEYKYMFSEFEISCMKKIFRLSKKVKKVKSDIDTSMSKNVLTIKTKDSIKEDNNNI